MWAKMMTVERLEGPSVAEVIRAIREGRPLTAGDTSPDGPEINPAALARTLLFNTLGQTFDGRTHDEFPPAFHRVPARRPLGATAFGLAAHEKWIER